MFEEKVYSELLKDCKNKNLIRANQRFPKKKLIELLQNHAPPEKNVLIIGLGCQKNISVSKNNALFTGVQNQETLSWSDLTVKKTISKETFSLIIIYQPDAFFCVGGIIDFRKISTVVDTLQSSGEIKIIK